MQNIKKCIDTYTNNRVDTGLKIIRNGQYERTMSEDDLELTRFMIGGMDAK
ncbi:hypothetical protein [Methanolobus profundi]|uniref:Uncharacterized protein n=1 Tax=Methanolobus profundi TaxID=487685 RepID=A0A1I4P4I6_9EURY|nr:hypothetical protein [Methanolobus profundi]SFM22688.1 hypothetical protein SAMN04488696_0449 [Methanolobus profundi]